MSVKYLLAPLLLFLNLTAYSQKYEWAKKMGSINTDIGVSIAVDDSGNVYTTGYFEGTADFDPGAGTANLISNGLYDIYIQKLDSDGNYLWAKSMGANGSDAGQAITVDAAGNVYTTGLFWGTVDFDPGSGSAILTSNGGEDIFIQKLDASGNFMWVKQMGGTSNDVGLFISIDYSGNIYTTGYFYGVSDFDPGAGIWNLTSAGNSDIFIQKLDLSGNFVWAQQMGGTSNDVGNSIVIDFSGNVYTTGYFTDTADFDPGAGSSALTSNGLEDIFVQKLDASGNFIWAKQIGGTGGDIGHSLAVDSSGNVYFTGYFSDTVDFDPGSGTMVLMSSGSADIFIQKLDTYGNLIWVKQIGGTGSDVGRFITINYLGALYATGYFYGTADFDPGGGNSSLTSAGSSDIFILKLDTNGNFIWVNQMGATGSDVGYSILANTSGDVYSTGYFRGTVDFNTGAGTANLTSSGFSSIDIYVQKLGPCVSSSATINISACDSFVSPSGNYVWTSSNTYMDTIPNNDGCDSAITLNLIINNSNTGDTTAVVCDSFTWYGITYTSSDSPTHIFTNAAGCDSVVTLKLTINAVDTSVTQVAFTFTSNASGAGYRWLDCAAGYSIIINETNQSFTATANGSYAVEVTENGCVDTSACHAVNNIGIMENNFINKMTIYPNPFTEKFSIDLGGTYQNISLVITDINGQTIKALTLDRSNLLNMTMEAPPGIYIVKIISGNMHVVFKLVKI